MRAGLKIDGPRFGSTSPACRPMRRRGSGDTIRGGIKVSVRGLGGRTDQEIPPHPIAVVNSFSETFRMRWARPDMLEGVETGMSRRASGTRRSAVLAAKGASDHRTSN